VTKLSDELLDWFKKHGRKTLPWQSNPTNIYYVWVSEVMLQQTQVATVINYFKNFIFAFPNIKALAQAEDDDVLALWAGLGYYSRARNLHKSAKIILSKHNGVFPKNYSDVVALPGVGDSTAGAILSLAYNQHLPILDGNVKRVLSRYHEVEGHYSSNDVLKTLWALAKLHTPKKDTAQYTQAIMDLGATVCTLRNPKCNKCPIYENCMAYLSGNQKNYPHKKIKKVRPEKSIVFLIYQNEKGEIYLEKRPNKGIWGGLWSFVECGKNDDEIDKAIKHHNKNAEILVSFTSFKHSFSHYHLWITPILVFSPRGVNGYYQAQDISLGMPAPVKKIIMALDSTNQKLYQ